MFETLKSLVSFRPKTCTHTVNYKLIRYRDSSGCPMVLVKCLDCDYIDKGPVIMPEVPNDWEGVINFKNGKETK